MSKRRPFVPAANAADDAKPDWTTPLWVFFLIAGGGLGFGIGTGLYHWGMSLFGVCK